MNDDNKENEEPNTQQSIVYQHTDSSNSNRRVDIRNRGWCFRLAHYTDDDILEMYNLTIPNHQAKVPFTYLIVGKEVCPTTGTPHLQGYIHFVNKKSFDQVVAMYDARMHWEAAKGSCQQNKTYCSKEGDFFEYGKVMMDAKMRSQQATEEYENTRLCAMEGRLDDITAKHFVAHNQAIKNIMKDNMAKPADLNDTCGIWIQGPSGCGKSRYAREHYAPFHTKAINRWFDGYRLGENVIMDDMDPRHHGMEQLIKTWTDRYHFKAEIKGSAMNIRPNQFVITSQYTIAQCFTDANTVEALQRRFTVIDMFQPEIRIFKPTIPPVNNMFINRPVTFIQNLQQPIDTPVNSNFNLIN